jgi:hypothetical protein
MKITALNWKLSYLKNEHETNNPKDYDYLRITLQYHADCMKAIQEYFLDSFPKGTVK